MFYGLEKPGSHTIVQANRELDGWRQCPTTLDLDAHDPRNQIRDLVRRIAFQPVPIGGGDYRIVGQSLGQPAHGATVGVSDPGAVGVNPTFNAEIFEDGALAALGHPFTVLPGLIRLDRNCRLAAERLGEFLGNQN